MSEQPKPAGEWTAKPSQTHGWYIEFDRGNGASIGNELTAKGIVNAHNAALAAEREKVQTLVDAIDAASNFMDYLRANTGISDEWPVELKVATDAVEPINQLLNEFEKKVYAITKHAALAKVKEGK